MKNIPVISTSPLGRPDSLSHRASLRNMTDWNVKRQAGRQAGNTHAHVTLELTPVSGSGTCGSSHFGFISQSFWRGACPSRFPSISFSSPSSFAGVYLKSSQSYFLFVGAGGDAPFALMARSVGGPSQEAVPVRVRLPEGRLPPGDRRAVGKARRRDTGNGAPTCERRGGK